MYRQSYSLHFLERRGHLGRRQRHFQGNEPVTRLILVQSFRKLDNLFLLLPKIFVLMIGTIFMISLGL